MLGVETQGRCPKQSFQDSRCFRVAASGFVKRCVFICICEVSVDRKTKVSRVAKAEAEAVKRGHWLPFSLARRSFQSPLRSVMFSSTFQPSDTSFLLQLDVLFTSQLLFLETKDIICVCLSRCLFLTFQKFCGCGSSLGITCSATRAAEVGGTAHGCTVDAE